MKNILFKIGVLSFVIGIIMFIPQVNLVTSKIKAATITLEEATKAIDDLGIEFKHDTKGKNQRNLAISIYKDAIENNEKQAVAKERAAKGVISNMNTDLSKEGRWKKNPDGEWEFKENKIQDRNDIAYLDIVNAHKIPQGSAIKQVEKACPQEGIEGVDFLVFHGPLVPCGISKQCDASNITDSKIKQRIEELSHPCTICHFIILIKNVFDLLLSMIITASLFMLTIAGVLYIVSSGGQMTGVAKGIIEKTLLGFGIFLLSWLIVYTLLNMLSVRETDVLGKGGTDSWFQFSCDTVSKFYTPADGTGAHSGNETGGTGAHSGNETGGTGAHSGNETGGTGAHSGNETGGTGAHSGNEIGEVVDLSGVNSRDISPYNLNRLTRDEVIARRDLINDSDNNIMIWESSPMGTNIQALKPQARNGLLSFQREVGVPIQVNGGAETSGPHTSRGEYSHRGGHKVDVQSTPVLLRHVRNYEYAGRRSYDNAPVWRHNGNYYAEEEGKNGGHLDICFSCPLPPMKQS